MDGMVGDYRHRMEIFHSIAKDVRLLLRLLNSL